MHTRLGSALFNASHLNLGEEVRRVEAAGVDFFHLDVFDGYFVPDQAFAARTVKALRGVTKLPFEIHLAVEEPLRFIAPLADAGADLVFLPAESTPLLYESIYALRERNLKAGLCLALGTPLEVLAPVVGMLDAVLLLGRVTGEGKRGREFNRLVIDRVGRVREMIDRAGVAVDLQAAGGLETESCVEAVRAGATSLPLGAALHREADMGAYVSMLRTQLVARADGAPGIGSEMRQSKPPTTSYKVLVASRSFGKNCPEVLDGLKAFGCVFLPNPHERAPSESEMVELIAEADVLVSGTEPVTAKVLGAAARLKVISKHGVGYENIDLDAARARGIAVCIAGGAISDSVADLTMGLLLALARQIPQGDRAIREGKWPRFVGPELGGKTLGIVGLGQIGKAVARRAKGFGLSLLAHDAVEDRSFAGSWGISYTSLDDLLRRSDFVSLHAPVTAQTRQMISAERLALMKPTAYLVNTARGELVDEAALFAALSEKRLAGAASDVFVAEPPDKGHPLLTLCNFIATPHIAGQTAEGLRRMGEITAENIMRVLGGGEAVCRIA